MQPVGWQLIKLNSGESKVVSPWSNDSDEYTMVYQECMSIKCPPWIIVNTEDKTVRVNGRKTRNKKAKGMYMILVGYYNKEQYELDETGLMN